MKYVERLFPTPHQSYFLFGPRGTGKSTMLRKRHPDALWIDLLDLAQERSLLAHPERLKEILEANKEKQVVIIDEVQKVPKLLSVVHEWIERKTNQLFILTGSSLRKLKEEQINLLGGRALKCSMYPFLATELGTDFSLEEALNNGLMPIVWGRPQPQTILNSYVSLYLTQEVAKEGLVKKLDDFSRFLEAMSFSHGQQLNLSNIAHECQVKRKTVENYLIILEELMLAYRVPVFTKRAQRELSQHPKFYYYDAGIFQTLRPKGPLDRKEEIAGPGLEGFIFQQLRAFIDYGSIPHDISFYRTRSGVEVDFIVYGPTYFWAIEIKNSKTVNNFDLKALESFLKDYPEAQGFLLYRGQDKYKIGNVTCMPCEQFLAQLLPNLKALS